MQNNWLVKYLANQSKIVDGFTLIWRKAVAVTKHNSYRPEMVLFKFGRLKIISQTTTLKTLPVILQIRYARGWHSHMQSASAVKILTEIFFAALHRSDDCRHFR